MMGGCSCGGCTKWVTTDVGTYCTGCGILKSSRKSIRWHKSPPTEPGWYRCVAGRGEPTVVQLYDDGCFMSCGSDMEGLAENVSYWDHRPIDLLPPPEDTP